MKCLLCGKDINQCTCCTKPIWEKKGQLQLYAFMVGLVIIILALALAPSVVEFSSTAQQQTNLSNDTIGLSCANASISNFDKIACYATDLTPMYFIGSLIMIGGVIFVAKILFS